MEEPKQEEQKPELPKRKWNSPVSKIVCWKCRGHWRNQPLRNVKDANGKKTKDYVCDLCFALGFDKPAIGNVSEVKFHYAG